MGKDSESRPTFLRKDVLIASACSWLAALFLFVAYHLWGTSFINAIYGERSFSFLNEIMAGRDSHSVEFYINKAGNLTNWVILFLFALPVVVTLFVALRQGNKGTFRLMAPIFAADLILPAFYGISINSRDSFFRNFFNLDGEGNLPTWYSSVKLFLVGSLFLVLAQKFRERNSAGVWVLVLLALSFFVLSLDEVAQIHEYLGDVSDMLLPGGARQNTMFPVTGIWMFLLAVPFLIFMLCAIGMLSRYVHNPTSTKKYIVGLIVFLGSAGGLEIVSNMVDPAYGALQVWTEEFGEMLGVSIILWATCDLLADHGVHIFNPCQDA